MSRVASINRTAGRGTLSARSGRTPRIPGLFVCSSRERERERERESAHNKSQHHIKHNHTGEKEDEEIQKNSFTRIYKIELLINVPQSSSLRSTSSKIPRTSSAALSRARKIYSLLLPFPFSSSSSFLYAQLMMTTRSYTNEENNRSFCCWGVLFFFLTQLLKKANS